MAYEHRFRQYDCNNPQFSHAELDAMSSVGWEMVSSDAAFPYLTVLWRRPVADGHIPRPPVEAGDGSAREIDGSPVGEVWRELASRKARASSLVRVEDPDGGSAADHHGTTSG